MQSKIRSTKSYLQKKRKNRTEPEVSHALGSFVFLFCLFSFYPIPFHRTLCTFFCAWSPVVLQATISHGPGTYIRFLRYIWFRLSISMLCFCFGQNGRNHNLWVPGPQSGCVYYLLSLHLHNAPSPRNTTDLALDDADRGPRGPPPSCAPCANSNLTININSFSFFSVAFGLSAPPRRLASTTTPLPAYQKLSIL